MAIPFLRSPNLGIFIFIINLKVLITKYWLPWTPSFSTVLENRRSTLQNSYAAPDAPRFMTFSFSSRGFCASNIFLSPHQSWLALLQLYFIMDLPSVWENQGRIFLLETPKVPDVFKEKQGNQGPVPAQGSREQGFNDEKSTLFFIVYDLKIQILPREAWTSLNLNPSQKNHRCKWD